MIEIRNLGKKIGAETILKDISFSVQKGEVLGFLGPNGAGKTTTMKIITGFWTPSSGDVLVDGVSVMKDSLKTRAKIGYLPEHVPLYEDMLVYEYLKFVADVRGVSKADFKERLKNVTDLCGLKNVIKRPIDELSKGYRQRVGLAQAIIHNPDVLILDEPTTGLDPNQIVEIRDLIKKIGKEKTVIFSTHILSEVSATCDRVIVINKGQIVKEGSPSDMIRESGSSRVIYAVIKAFKEEVLKKFNEVEKINKVDIVAQLGERVFAYEIEPKEGVDLREYLSVLIIHSGWTILEFREKISSLEDAFKRLTYNK